ncbi:hypothetical protein [Marinobacter sp. CA1]|uniref:hypothetical protein n=1 Tax=Marinobacter sp. CA1 TaxID=2817656 RepID=UPI001D06C6A0|nr:hypothetical protein [Marinobacter sp. CA1]UDL03328.1 hypothetical protein J2887_11165 [Marinobacter sp. CA1]
MKAVRTGIVLIAVVLGLTLLAINLYGLSQPLRKPGLGVTELDQLRFVPKEVVSYHRSLALIDELAELDSPHVVAERANQITNASLVHVDWKRVDPVAYRQLVPVWENYFLWAIGRFSGLPQFERYHYADYRRNLKRGIGICGDASTILSSVLDRYDIDNRIVSFAGGHVIVEYQVPGEESARLLDPDFGVPLTVSLDQLLADPGQVRDAYLAAGYSAAEVDYLVEIYGSRYALFDDTYHFMTKRYLFENMSYVMKWLLPVGLLAVAVFLAPSRQRRFHG